MKPSTLYPRQKDRLACVQMSPISVAAGSPQTEYDPWGLISRDAKYERTKVTETTTLGLFPKFYQCLYDIRSRCQSTVFSRLNAGPRINAGFK